MPGIEWTFLRFVREEGTWRPAAGTFPGWPKRAAEIAVMDPCCGSGHFLTEAFAILAALRTAEERLAARDAAAAVLRDNLFGLEIDGRCVQIAAFAVALTAWRLAGQPYALPVPHIAWVGQPLAIGRNEFTALANGDARLKWGLERLWDLFAQAHTLGSLMDPRALAGTLDAAGFDQLATSLDDVFARLKSAEPDRTEGAITARGMADAAALLARRYTVQTTNVPYLGRGKQVPTLAAHIDRTWPDAKADLATAMLSRLLSLAVPGGSVAVVTPQNWYALSSYSALRRNVLTTMTLNAACDLGPAAFQDMNWWASRTALTILTNSAPEVEASSLLFHAGGHRDAYTKGQILAEDSISNVQQQKQLGNPDVRIVTEPITHGSILSGFAASRQGIKTGDDDLFRRCFWENILPNELWRYFQSSPIKRKMYTGCSWCFSGRTTVRIWRDGKVYSHTVSWDALLDR